MNMFVFSMIDDIFRKYTGAFGVTNAFRTLNPIIIAHVNDTEKECILNDLDIKLPYGINFSHSYKNGRLKVIFGVDINES